MIRELTSLAVLAYALLLIWSLWSTGDERSSSSFYEYLTSPSSVWLHAVVLGLSIYHTGTWIALTPKVLVLWRDDEQVDPSFIAGMMGILFLIVSGAVLWLSLS